MDPLSRVTPATVDVLAALQDSHDPIWGLAIIKSSGHPAGSVYPILDRLERSGWVTSAWADEPDRAGPRRRYYELTADGARAARPLLNARVRTAIGRAATA
ncbi:MAG: PadR family transcriptional regulator [Pseudolysinimonas sp.]